MPYNIIKKFAINLISCSFIKDLTFLINTVTDMEEKIDKILLDNFKEGDWQTARKQLLDLFIVSGSAFERYRKALGYISEMTFEIEIGTEKGSDVLEKALRIASGYNVE